MERSITKLKKSPDNAKALKTLNQAYNLEVKIRMEEVYRFKNGTDIYKWEKIVSHYKKLNSFYDDIQRCPACLKVIPDPNRYVTDLDDALNRAANVRYDIGVNLLTTNSLQDAQEAFRNFLIAKSYVNSYKDIDQQLKLAKEAGTLRVVMEHIPMYSRSMQLSTLFFENQIHEYLTSLNYEFVRFYTPEQVRTYNVTPHEYIQIQFDDFVVGQTSLYEKEKMVTRDSVVLGTDKEKKNVYGTVKATLHTFTKTMTSTGVIDMRIVDAKSNSVLSQNKLGGTYVWETHWGWFTGDERALSSEELDCVRQREAFPPPPQQLFIEFTKPIFSQVTARVISQYKRYRL